MAKRFFLVCAGIFLLALSFHCWFSLATAQVGSLVQVGDIETQYADGIAAVSGRTVYTANWNGFRRSTVSPPVPGTAPIVAVDGADGIVMLANGDVYASNGTSWLLQGSMIGPTPAAQKTWGQLKATYRK